MLIIYLFGLRIQGLDRSDFFKKWLCTTYKQSLDWQQIGIPEFIVEVLERVVNEMVETKNSKTPSIIRPWVRLRPS
jgi:hypothetical protein